MDLEIVKSLELLKQFGVMKLKGEREEYVPEEYKSIVLDDVEDQGWAELAQEEVRQVY